MRTTQAFDALGFPTRRELINADDVRQRFNERVKAAHPDNGGAGADMALLKEARDTLLAFCNISEETSCPVCKGHGTVQARIGVTPCHRCDGTGVL